MSDEIETVQESSKAAQEVAKATGKAIDAAREFGGFFRKVFGQAIIDGVGIYSDRISMFRYENGLLLRDGLKRRLGERGLEHLRVVPPKVGIPLLEHALLEDEDDLRFLWTNLLASALDPKASNPKKKYVSVLAELDANDAAILKALRVEWETVDKTEVHRERGVRYAPGIDGVGSHDEVAIITLARMGLIRSAPTEIDSVHGRDDDEISFGEAVQVSGDLRVVQLTAFGIAFCEAVGIDPAPSSDVS